MNLLCNICGGWSWMVINQVLCFAKYTCVIYFIEWWQFHSISDLFILKTWRYQTQLKASIFHVYIISVNTKIKSLKLWCISAETVKIRGCITLTFISWWHSTKLIQSGVTFSTYLFFLKWNVEVALAKTRQDMCMFFALRVSHLPNSDDLINSHFALHFPWCTAAVTTTIRHFRFRGTVTPAKELGHPSGDTRFWPCLHLKRLLPLLYRQTA